MIWGFVVLGLYVVGMLGLAWVSLHPIRTPNLVSPGAMGAPQEDVEIQSEELTLRGWWVDAPDSSGVVVLSHGYMMNRSELAPVAYQLWRRGISCLLVDFRAHGRSGGKKCSLGYGEAADVIASVEYARRRCPGARIALLGSSMGAAAGAIACGSRPGLVDALVLDSGYSRLSSAIVGWWRFLGGRGLAAVLSPTVLLAAPLAGFNPFRVDVAKFLADAGPVPVLVLHGDRDNLALPSEASRNYEACTGDKTLVWFIGMGHCEGRWEQPGRYLDALFGFLEGAGVTG